MQNLDLFQTIGAGLAMFYSFVWLTLHFRAGMNAVWSFIKSALIWLGRLPIMIKEWRRWRKYQPSWKVIGSGRIDLTAKPHGEYHVIVTVPIRYTSRDNHFETRITHTFHSQLLEIKHSGSNREENPYRLLGEAEPPQIDLSPGQYKDVVFQFEKMVMAKPPLGKIIQCRLKQGANIYLVGIHTDKFLKSNKWFKLEVSDE